MDRSKVSSKKSLKTTKSGSSKKTTKTQKTVKKSPRKSVKRKTVTQKENAKTLEQKTQKPSKIVRDKKTKQSKSKTGISNSKLKLAFISSEAVPLVKVGGLADVVGSLPKVLKSKSVEPIIVIPGYKSALAGLTEVVDTGITISSPVGANWIEARIKKVEINDIDYYLVCCDAFYNRDGIYGDKRGDYPDNLERFSFFCKVALELFKRIGFQPDILHCNDWQTGLLPVFKSAFYGNDPFYSSTKVVFAVHNLAYQGLFPVEKFYLLGLDWGYFTYQGVEFYGKLNCLKAGLIFSDAIVTVSPTYAYEIQTPDYGYGLDGVLRSQKQKIVGILNGIDYEKWNPLIDKFIYENYGLKAGRLYLKGKAVCKQSLLEEIGLAQSDKPLVIMISRLVEQKGVDLIVTAMQVLLKEKKCQFVVLGKGDEYYEDLVRKLGDSFSESCKVFLCFDEVLAHKLYAGADIITIPSRYEPCGLSQMIAMRYGTIPVVRKTGGLADTVSDKVGFLFDKPMVDELLSCLGKAITAYYDKKLWREMIKRAMMQDFSWNFSARKYLQLYRKLLKKGEK